jgi:uncharacterized membrane protein YhhN
MLEPLLSAFSLICVVVLLRADQRGQARAALIAKSGASLGFVLLGLSNGGTAPHAFPQLVLAGLVCSALGDVLLALPGARAFQTGVGAFFAGHVLYIAAAVSALHGALPPIWAWLVLLPSIGAYAWLYPQLGVMRGAVAAYIVAISAMVAYALALFVVKRPLGAWFLAGASLFYLSDLSVARDRFVKPALINRLWGLPAYYVGQLLIAHAIALA